MGTGQDAPPATRQQPRAARRASKSQIPAAAKAKIAGLAQWYGIRGERDVQFFSVHMEADVNHSATSRDLLRRLCDTPEKQDAAESAAQETVDALYRFLDGVTA